MVARSLHYLRLRGYEFQCFQGFHKHGTELDFVSQFRRATVEAMFGVHEVTGIWV